MSRNQSPSSSDSFLFQETTVRAQVEDNQLWFVAKDVCEALGIIWKGSGISGSLASIPECWQRVVKFTTHRRGSQSFRCISEPAVYKLAFRSSKPRAEAFTNWIASEVVPAIRKTGTYEAPKPRRTRKAEQLPLPPAALPALIDEAPFLEFINEVQAAHEEVDRILTRLHHSVFTLTWRVAEALEKRGDIRISLVPDMLFDTTLRGYLHQSVYHDVKKALTAPGRQLEEYSNPGYSLLGIVRQLNAR